MRLLQEPSYKLRLPGTNQTLVQHQQYNVRGLLRQPASRRHKPRCFPTGDPSSRKGLKASSQFRHRINAWRAEGLGWVTAPDHFSGHLLHIPNQRADQLLPSLLERACSGDLRGKGNKMQKPRKRMALSSLCAPFLNLKMEESFSQSAKLFLQVLKPKTGWEGEERGRSCRPVPSKERQAQPSPPGKNPSKKRKKKE